ncbi:IclR family transcriptional regulator domain-containing protein [Falsirhodobacter sp. 1013]|uniref:IclR family transcriptional regulator domain-containing protein n=1 Tax=Falsirhodobacter sp. 1013 TaxID=3417566 RepID=UPI003EBFC0EC
MNSRSQASDTVRGTALLTKALDILEFVAEGDRRLKFKDIAEHTGHTRSTLYRILAALTSRGMLDVDQRDQSYILGPKFTAMAGSINQNSDLIARASGPLADLADIYGENVNLAVMSGTVPVTVARWQGAGAQPFSTALGEKKPLHATSVGKALLAFADEEARTELLRRVDYTRYTDHTIVSPEALMADLNISRARGYAQDDNEIIEGVVCVAAPIFGTDGKVAAAASFNVPAHRMDMARRAELASVLQDVARRIGEDLTPQAAPQDDRQLSSQLRVADVKAFQARNLRWDAATASLYWIDRAGGTINRQNGGKRETLAVFDRPINAISQPEAGVIHAASDGRLWRMNGTERAEIVAHPALGRVLRMHRVGSSFLLTLPEGLMLLTPDGRTEILTTCDGRFHSSGVTEDGRIATSTEEGTEIAILQLGPDARVVDRMAVHLDRPARGVVALHLAADGGISLSQRDGWAVWQYDAQGRVLRSCTLPVPNVASMTGGETPSILYAGSDRLSLTSNQLRLAPLSGGIFRIDTSV